MFFGGWNVEVKYLRNDKGLVVCLRDATSAIVLNMPEIWSTERMPASQTWSRVAKAVRMFAAEGETLVLNLYIQVTAEMLSHQIAGLVCRNSVIGIPFSSASQCISIPNSSRSEMVILPAGLMLVHSCVRTASGHSKYQTNGSSFLVPLNHTPPTPHLEALTSP